MSDAACSLTVSCTFVLHLPRLFLCSGRIEISSPSKIGCQGLYSCHLPALYFSCIIPLHNVMLLHCSGILLLASPLGRYAFCVLLSYTSYVLPQFGDLLALSAMKNKGSTLFTTCHRNLGGCAVAHDSAVHGSRHTRHLSYSSSQGSVTHPQLWTGAGCTHKSGTVHSLEDC